MMLALDTLRDERFNSQVAATLAVLAPPPLRRVAVEAIVALEVLYDYLDTLVEQPTSDPLGDGHRLYLALTRAIRPPSRGDEARRDGYLGELAGSVRTNLERLPSAWAVRDVALRAASRNAGAQVRAHAVTQVGSEQLEGWAIAEAAGTELDWREYLMGAASSVLVIHALIAAAADPRTTPEQAKQIDRAYLSIAALCTMLDSLIDHEQDARAGNPGYLKYYESLDALADRLTTVARHALTALRGTTHEAHHVMTVVGVAAYYLSAPEADSELARPVASRLAHELRPIIAPTLALMRAWRLAKRLRID